jgi:hypothetical protein
VYAYARGARTPKADWIADVIRLAREMAA